MGKFKEEHGITRVGAFLRNTAPQILEVASDLTGIQALDKIAESITGSTSMSEQDKATALELIKQDYADVQNARAMQIEALRQDDKFSKRFVYYLATIIISAAILFGCVLLFVSVPPENKRLVEMFADLFLFAGGIMVLQFFFGSSKGSIDKQEFINRMKKD